MTALGRPLIPMENGRMAKSSLGLKVTSGKWESSSLRRSETNSHSSSSPIINTWSIFRTRDDSLARCASWWLATMHLALDSLSWLVNSWHVKCGLTPVTTPPIWSTPRNIMANSGTFGAKIATTSPLIIPLLLRAEPNFLLRSLTWEKV